MFGVGSSVEKFFVLFAYQNTSATLNFGGRNITRIESLSDMIGVGDLIKNYRLPIYQHFSKLSANRRN